MSWPTSVTYLFPQIIQDQDLSMFGNWREHTLNFSLAASFNLKDEHESLKISVGNYLGVNTWWSNTFVNPVIGCDSLLITEIFLAVCGSKGSCWQVWLVCFL